MTTHVMLDLETLGTKSGSVIISIGACKFDPNQLTRPEDSFYVQVDPVSSVRHGLTMDPSTVLWWMHKDRTVPREEWLAGDKVDLPTALEGFAMWFGAESLPVWGNGATFDNVLLRDAYDKTGLDCPWKYNHDRCYRTMKNLVSIDIKRVGEHHNALDDAITQAQHLQDIIDFMGTIAA